MMAISEMNTDKERASASSLVIDNHDRYVKPLVHHHAPANTVHRVRLGRRDFCPLPRLHQMATDTKHAFETQSHVLPSLFSVQSGVADAYSPEPTSHISLTAAHVSDRSAHLDLRTLHQTIESAPQLLRPCAAPSVARYKTVKNYGHRLLWHLPCLFPLRCALSSVCFLRCSLFSLLSPPALAGGSCCIFACCCCCCWFGSCCCFWWSC